MLITKEWLDTNYPNVITIYRGHPQRAVGAYPARPSNKPSGSPGAFLLKTIVWAFENPRVGALLLLAQDQNFRHMPELTRWNTKDTHGFTEETLGKGQRFQFGVPYLRVSCGNGVRFTWNAALIGQQHGIGSVIYLYGKPKTWVPNIVPDLSASLSNAIVTSVLSK